METEPLFYIRDKVSGWVHGFGENSHDDIWVDGEGTLRYTNLQTGDGCGAKSLLADEAGYEFCPMLDGLIAPGYYETHKADFAKSGYQGTETTMGYRITRKEGE